MDGSTSSRIIIVGTVAHASTWHHHPPPYLHTASDQDWRWEWLGYYIAVTNPLYSCRYTLYWPSSFPDPWNQAWEWDWIVYPSLPSWMLKEDVLFGVLYLVYANLPLQWDTYISIVSPWNMASVSGCTPLGKTTSVIGFLMGFNNCAVWFSPPPATHHLWSGCRCVIWSESCDSSQVVYLSL